MSLRDEIECLAQYRDWDNDTALADNIIALVKMHLTSDEAVERIMDVLVRWPSPGNLRGALRAAITAALGDTHD